MPGFAPRTSILAALGRGQSARDAHAAGKVVLAGVEYDCELHLGPLKPEEDAGGGGVFLVQRGRAVIWKTALGAAPARDSVIRVNGADYQVEDVGGHDAHEPAWVIPFNRIPPPPSR